MMAFFEGGKQLDHSKVFCEPLTTAANTVNAVAMFASVEGIHDT
jgi:hypothetical protein